MKILESYNALQAARQPINLKVGFVPTMGALHEGHLSLVRLAKTKADIVFASIFVNPTQFGPTEDFNKYPRTISEDIEKLEGLADYIYLPQVENIYPEGYKTTSAGAEAKGLDGDFRPGHFDGVATVVNILFEQVRPDVAIFGEKDYQQLMVIKEMAQSLHPEIEIIGAATLREPDGLALSSRNRYLSPEERKKAALLYSSLRDMAEAIQDSNASDPGLLRSARNDAVKKLEEVGFKVDYIEKRWNRLLLAVHMGSTRLIDNIPL